MRGVIQMTQKQADFIKKLLATKNFTQLDAELLASDMEMRNGKTQRVVIDLDNTEALDTATASKLIDALIKSESKAEAEAREIRKAAALNKHNNLIEWAKANGVKATANMKASTVRGKILEAGLEIPVEYQGKIADKTVGKW
jgi:hypothetical protein